MHYMNVLQFRSLKQSTQLNCRYKSYTNEKD